MEYYFLRNCFIKTLTCLVFFFCITHNVSAQDNLSVEEEFVDKAKSDFDKYFVDGDSVTFSSNPGEIEFSIIGKWELSKNTKQELQLHFTDPETVIADFGLENGQTKGTWFLTDDVITIELRTRDSKTQSKINGVLKRNAGETVIVAEGFGSLKKIN